MDGSAATRLALDFGLVGDSKDDPVEFDDQIALPSFPGWLSHIVTGCSNKGRDGHSCTVATCSFLESKASGRRQFLIH